MLKASAAFSGFSVNNIEQAQEFYNNLLGTSATVEAMGLRLHLPGGSEVFVYQKDNHVPAEFTILNYVVEDIDQAVKQLSDQGISFERYPQMSQDKQGIMRGLTKNMGPDIAWFKDPAGNILSVLKDK